MKNFNNLYNFKNPVRHFFNLDSILFQDDFSSITKEKLSWTKPIKFKIRKDELKFRLLKFPNILNFACALREFKNDDFFLEINAIDDFKRANPNIVTGEFKVNSFSENLEQDFFALCVYDNLIKLDIKSFYGRIYLHNLKLSSRENYINNQNNGMTNELILGNYISLYLAEMLLSDIVIELEKELSNNSIECKISYFSDDFYIFCNKRHNLTVIKIFDDILSNYDLERNEDKVKMWTYEEYSDFNLIEKYWKKIVSEDKSKNENVKGNNPLNFYFINQLIYRKTLLKDVKQQKIFINNFFKSTYFNGLKFEKYELQDFNCHQLLNLIKFSPEIILYVVKKFKDYEIFQDKIVEFLRIRYTESFLTNFFEEQLYYFYALKTLNFNQILKDNSSLAINSENQILQSLYLMNNYFDTEEINMLKTREKEDYWLVNYHLILYTDLNENLNKNIEKYLIPKHALSNPDKCKSYFLFYNKNLEAKISLISPVDKISENIQIYLDYKISERASINKSATAEVTD